MNPEIERAKHLVRQGKLGEGLELLEKIAPSDPGPGPSNDAGVCAYLLAEDDRAMQWFQEAEKKSPGFALSRINRFYLGKALDLKRNYDLTFRSINHDNMDQSAPRPKISVIVRTFNRPELLRHALQCLKDQTYKNFETIVVNDGGPETVAEVCRQAGLPGLRYWRFEHGGPAAGLNRGLEMARGDFIAFFDDDDTIYPNHLAGLLQRLEREGRPGVAYSDVRINYFDRDEKLLRSEIRCEPKVDLSVLMRYDPVSSMLVLASREIFEKLGRFYEPLAVTGNDWEMWLRIVKQYPFFHWEETSAEFQQRDRPDRGSRLGLVERYYYSNLVLYLHRGLKLFSFPLLPENDAAYSSAIAELGRLMRKYPELEKKIRLYGLYHARSVAGFFFERYKSLKEFGQPDAALDFLKVALALKPLEPRFWGSYAREIFSARKGAS